MGDVDANDVSAALADGDTEVTDGGDSSGADPSAHHTKTFTVVLILVITLVVCVGFYFLLKYLGRPVKASERQKSSSSGAIVGL